MLDFRHCRLKYLHFSKILKPITCHAFIHNYYPNSVNSAYYIKKTHLLLCFTTKEIQLTALKSYLLIYVHLLI